MGGRHAGEAHTLGGTVAPLVVKDMVIGGVAGGDWGVRGFLAAIAPPTANFFGGIGPFHKKENRVRKRGAAIRLKQVEVQPGPPAPTIPRRTRSTGPPAIPFLTATENIGLAMICTQIPYWR